ncbi:MAG TPA: O-antigen ligase family protein [Solirubrobacteraceae bacterium]|nr:O-antigen ligase family protein [Solirubrobacteraceae bacterium]
MSGPSLPPTAAALPGAGVIAAALVGALIVIGLLSALLVARPNALPLAALAALPFRLPISAQGRTVNLLIPLYLVVAAAVVSLLWRRAAGERVHALAASVAGDGGPGAGLGLGRWRGWLSGRGLRVLLLGVIALYVLQAAYSDDRAKAAENVAFFYVPFALLFLMLCEVRFTRRLVLACLGVVAGLAVVFAGVGFVEYYRKTLFLNPKVVAANQFDNYFRVNSVFFDPSIYGRFLALVIIALAAAMLWSARRRDVAVAAALIAWLMAGLVTSFSQSSIAALLLGLAVLAAYRWDVRATLYIAVALVAIAVVVLLAAPSSLHFGLNGSGGSTNNATNGRASLISGGLDLFAARPLQGYGSGSFESEYRRHRQTSAENATTASHTIPITIAAEQGVIGLALYAALLVVAFAVLFAGAGRSPPRIAVAACFAALVLHTWTYADFLEDPITWTLLGIGVALARGAGALEDVTDGRAALTGAGLGPALQGSAPGEPASSV